MSAPSASLPFDTRPLTDPVDRATVRAYVQQLRQSGRAPAGGAAKLIIGIVVGIVFLVIFGSTFISIVGSFLSIGLSGGAGGGSPIFVILPIFMLIVVTGVAAIAVTAIVRAVQGGSGARWYRLDRFARANGMTWYPEAQAPPLPGMIFGSGHSRVATDIVRGDRPRLVEFANYRYKTGSGKEETTHTWGYVAVKLSAPLPHIVLDATGNNGMFGSNLPTSFDRDQRLSLEGDFDRHFALYCPRGYERDALYLFTPDIMARFIDTAAALDVEIVDDWLFLYTRRDVSTLDPATWAWLFSVVAALLDKLGQWERWRDDRLTRTELVGAPATGPTEPDAALPFAAPSAVLLPPPGVAAPGRRLKRGVPWVAVVILGAFVAMWVLGQFGVFAGIAGSFFGR